MVITRRRRKKKKKVIIRNKRSERLGEAKSSNYQLFTQGQWWSITSTQALQIEQW